MIKDSDFNEGMMKETLHLLFILSFLDNIGHLLNASEKIVGYIEHFYPREMHIRPNVIGIKPRKSTFT